MQIKFICPHWGQKGKPVPELITRAKAAGYDGMEINVASTGEETYELVRELKANRLSFIAQQWLPPAIETVEQYINRFQQNLEHIATLEPQFVNSHTGKDYFSFDDNCGILEYAATFTAQTGIPIFHETHRGRFAFHAGGTMAYLEKFPGLQFTADFSHWCTVSESMLNDQPDIMKAITPHVKYIHARVGYEHSPQVNDPRAPEWGTHLQHFLNWWDSIVKHHYKIGTEEIAICPEFGPPPYLPVMPYTRQPLADQWEMNEWMLDLLKKRYETL